MSGLQQELRGSALWLTIDRPQRRNAMDDAVVAGLASAIAASGENPEVRAIIITGSGDQTFCAGADIKEGKGLLLDPAHAGQPLSALFTSAHASSIPLVARVNGACVGGGMGLLAMCDMAVAADHASFGLPEIKVGLFPMQILAVLQGLIPGRLLHEMCMTGEPIDAGEAKLAGLVNHVVPAAELDAKVAWLVALLADKSPAALRHGRYAMRRIGSMPFEQLVAFTQAQMGLVMLTQDAKEGITAFREKRRPVWTGS